MKRALLWVATCVLSVLLTLAIFFPAAWLGSLVEQRTGGRLTLGDAQGTLWRGSAFIGGAAGGNGPVTPLLPGRFTWTISPLALIGMVDLRLENPEALAQPVTFKGSWSQWQLSASALLLPAEGLSGPDPARAVRPPALIAVADKADISSREGGLVVHVDLLRSSPRRRGPSADGKVQLDARLRGHEGRRGHAQRHNNDLQ